MAKHGLPLGMFSYHILSTFIFTPLLYYPIPYYNSEHPSSWSITSAILTSASTPCCCSLHQRAVATLPQLPLSTFPEVPWCVPAKCVLRLFCTWRLQFLGRLSSSGVRRCYRAVLAELVDLSYDHLFVHPILAAKSLQNTKPVGCFSKLGVTTDISILISNLSVLCW